MFSTVPSAPNMTVVGGDGAVIIWNTPEMPNGIIIEYELRFTGQGTTKTVQGGVEELYYVPNLADIPQTNGDTVTVEVSNLACFRPSGGVLHEHVV